MAGEALPPMDAIEGGLLDEMTRRAQEKLLIFQVGQEVQVNLQNIEQALDAFFRDNAKRAELTPLPAQFAQVQGALMIMELHDAASLNAAVMARVQQFTEGSADGVGDAADLVADGLSALGLYITALQQGSASAKETLVPALLRFGLLQPEPIGIESVVRRSHTVSPGDIELQKQKVQALYEDWKGAPVETTRAKLEKSLDELKRDAAVVSDSAVSQQSEAALQAMQENTDPQQSGLFRAITQLAPDNAPEQPAAQVVQLVDAPGAEVDKELLDIFLEEATEVVGTIGESLAACRDAPHDREALTTIRRGFHTLKGSGRMVGLNELGEMAWQCEQVLNKWLKDEKPATATLLGFIELARDSFSGWVGELKQSGAARIDGSAITRQAEALKSGEAAAPVEAPAAVAEVAAPVAEAAAPVQAPAQPIIESAPADEAHAPVEAVQAAAEASFDSLDFAAAPAEPAPAVAEPVHAEEAAAACRALIRSRTRPGGNHAACAGSRRAPAPGAGRRGAAARRHHRGGRGHRLARALLDLSRRSRAAHRLDGARGVRARSRHAASGVARVHAGRAHACEHVAHHRIHRHRRARACAREMAAGSDRPAARIRCQPLERHAPRRRCAGGHGAVGARPGAAARPQ
jgi:chemosensory pili system protein ChpA (sensor histidine kinase/response regulator)